MSKLRSIRRAIMSSKPYRPGQWLPSDRKVIDKWLSNLFDEIESNSEYKAKLDLLLKLHPPSKDEKAAKKGIANTISDTEVADLGLHPPVKELMNAILTDPEINMYFHQMFWQQRQLPSISDAKKVECWQKMIFFINLIMTKAPEFNKTGLVGFPINAILNWPMATTAGFAAFLNKKVNKLFKDILNYWGEFLKTYQSTYVLNDDPHKGWFGEDAMKAMPDFVKEFKCDPSKPHYGYTSWDDFFTREYRPKIRPVAEPDNNDVIANACESAPYKLARNVEKRDYFWIKSQLYSLDFMLDMDDLAKKFFGGTVYQGFLSVLSYHRWHSPVSGHVLKTKVVPGSYYSEAHDIQNDPAAPNESQGYLCQVAAQGIIYFLADNRDIGLMCFIAIGMCEVSSTEITVKPGDYVKKGDQIGMFHFGGSTHCLVFRPGVNVQFDLRGQTPGLDTKNIPVRSKIVTIVRPI